MKLAGIRVSSIANDLGGRVWNPRIRWSVKHAVFVELLCEDGRVGLGECWCFDAAPDALIAFLRTEVVPKLLEAELSEAGAVMAELTRRATLTARHGMLASALSGVDLALWDLVAQHKGLPLWRALDPEGAGEVLLYASGGLYAPDKDAAALAEELAGYAARGFSTVKMKIGGLPIEEDVARVAAARSRLGPHVGLIVDGVYSYDADQALALFDRIRDLDIQAFQSPLPPDDLAGMRSLCHEGVPVMGIEAEYREEVFAELIEGGAVAILQVAPVACGGPSRVLSLAARARAAGIGLSLETSSTAVATLAAAQLGAAKAAIDHVELHQIHRVFFDQLRLDAGRFEASRWRLPEHSGLGIALDPARVQVAFEAKAGSDRRKAAKASEVRLASPVGP